MRLVTGNKYSPTELCDRINWGLLLFVVVVTEDFLFLVGIRTKVPRASFGH